MRFSELPYRRPNLEEIEGRAAALLERIGSAASAQEQIDAYLAYEELERETNTACTLASIRHTIDTRDPFYDREICHSRPRCPGCCCPRCPHGCPGQR